VLNGPYLTSMAATSDGGVLAAGLGEGDGQFVTRFTAAGGSVWTFEVGKMFEDPSMGAAALSISSAGNSFIIGGSNDGTTDFDPGPAIDPVFGNLSYVSRFTF
jgi:hypothetical protein